MKTKKKHIHIAIAKNVHRDALFFIFVFYYQFYEIIKREKI